jgi:hypothetical protein
MIKRQSAKFVAAMLFGIGVGLVSESYALGTCMQPTSRKYTTVVWPPRDALLYVHDKTALTPTDKAIRWRLLNTHVYGRVDLLSETDPTPSLDEYDLIYIAGSVKSANLYHALQWSAIPVIVGENGAYDQFGFVSTNTQRGNAASTQIAITDPSHPLAAGLSGNVTVYSGPGSDCPSSAPPGQLTCSYINWATKGALSEYTEKVATVTGQSGRSALFALEAGSDGAAFPAVNNRIGFFLQDLPAGVTLTKNGWRLFDAAVKWATPPTTDQDAIMVVGNRDALTTRDLQIRDHLVLWFNTTVVSDEQVVPCLEGFELVLIAPSVDPTVVGAKYKNVPMALISSEAFTWDDLGWVSDSSGVGTHKTNKIYVADPSSPLVAYHPYAGYGLSGTLTVYDGGAGPVNFAWRGNLGAAASKATVVQSYPNRVTGFFYAPGALMPGGQAPSYRIGLFMQETAPQIKLAGDGVSVLDKAIRVAIGEYLLQ